MFYHFPFIHYLLIPYYWNINKSISLICDDRLTRSCCTVLVCGHEFVWSLDLNICIRVDACTQFSFNGKFIHGCVVLCYPKPKHLIPFHSFPHVNERCLPVRHTNRPVSSSFLQGFDPPHQSDTRTVYIANKFPHHGHYIPQRFADNRIISSKVGVHMQWMLKGLQPTYRKM